MYSRAANKVSLRSWPCKTVVVACIIGVVCVVLLHGLSTVSFDNGLTAWFV